MTKGVLDFSIKGNTAWVFRVVSSPKTISTLSLEMSLLTASIDPVGVL